MRIKVFRLDGQWAALVLADGTIFYGNSWKRAEKKARYYLAGLALGKKEKKS